MANPAFRSASSAADQTATTSFTVTAPAGIIDGDMLLLFQMQEKGTGTARGGITGWTNVSFASAGNHSFTRSFHVASSEPGSYTVLNPTTGLPTSSVYIIAISNPTGTTPEAGQNAISTSTTADPGTYTTTNTNDLIACAWGTNATGVSITPDGSFTALGTIGTVALLNVGYKSQPSPGVVGNRTATLGASNAWLSALYAIAGPAAVAQVLQDLAHTPSHQAMVAM